MAILSDILAALDRWDEWKRVKSAPAQIEALTARVAALEALLSGKRPLEYCRHCGEPACRPIGYPFVKDRMVHEDMVCDACQKRTRVIRKPD